MLLQYLIYLFSLIIAIDAGFKLYNGVKFHEAGYDTPFSFSQILMSSLSFGSYASGAIYVKLNQNATSKVDNLISIPKSDSVYVL